jgi:hypothetical protein
MTRRPPRSPRHRTLCPYTTLFRSKELLKASDEDVLSFLDKVSANVLTDVISLIEGRTKSFLSNEEPFKNLDFSEHKELIFSEAKKFVGVLLSKIK